MRIYNLIYLIPVDLEEKDVLEKLEELTSFIQENGGVLIERKELRRKKLGYVIKKKKEAYLGILEFQSPPEKLFELEKKLKDSPWLLRYMIAGKTPASVKRVPDKIAVTRRAEKTPKVELEQIEEKLEEMLKDS